MTGRSALTGASATLSLAIALATLLTVVTLSAVGRHRLLVAGGPPLIVRVDRLARTSAGVSWTLGQVVSGTRRLPLSTGAVFFRAPAGAPLELRGWAVDSAARAPLLGVIVRTDFGPPLHAVYGISRPDVAAVTCGSPCTNSGLQINFGPRAIPPGMHKLWLTAVRADARALYVAPAPLRFRITR